MGGGASQWMVKRGEKVRFATSDSLVVAVAKERGGGGTVARPLGAREKIPKPVPANKRKRKDVNHPRSIGKGSSFPSIETTKSSSLKFFPSREAQDRKKRRDRSPRLQPKGDLRPTKGWPSWRGGNHAKGSASKSAASREETERAAERGARRNPR